MKCQSQGFIWLLPLLLNLTQGWHLMMKVPKSIDLKGSHSVYDLWTSNLTVNEKQDSTNNVNSASLFKSADVQKWDNKSISLVKVSLYTGGKELAYVVFGAGGPAFNHSGWPVFETRANITNWFDCSRIVHSSWADLTASVPSEYCNIHSTGLSTLAHSFSLLNHGIKSQSDCDTVTGWLAVMDPASDNSAIQCPWKNTTLSSPTFLFAPGNSSLNLSDSRFQSADEFAIFVDDCIDDVLCNHGNCWQDPLGVCSCTGGYKCNEVCAQRPCTDGLMCVTDKNNQSAYTCISPPTTGASDSFGAGPIAGLVVGLVAMVALVVVGIWCFLKYRNREEQLKTEVTQRAVLAKDFVRRSVHRLSGRQHTFPRRQLKEEKPSPPVKGKSEQLSPNSSVVFGETNPAFMCEDDPPTPQPTPPPDRRYTEFPTRNVAPSVSTTEIQLHEKNQKQRPLPVVIPPHVAQAVRKYENAPFSRPDAVIPHPISDYDRASTIGSFEKASTMSEISDATSTSGYSDYTGDAPANLPPSEMISKDILRHGHRQKARSRPRSRQSTVDPPRTIAPQNVESQINYAMERSRRSISSLSSLSSDATHRSDGTIRSGELTKSEVLKARYENISHGDRLPRFPKSGNAEGPSYEEIKKQLDEDMSRREARERKLELEMEREARYQAQRALKHRMRQVESLDSGIDAEHGTVDRSSDGRIEIVRARSADQLDSNCSVSFSSREAIV